MYILWGQGCYANNFDQFLRETWDLFTIKIYFKGTERMPVIYCALIPCRDDCISLVSS